MAAFWEQIKKVFSKAEQTNEKKSAAVIHERIERPEDERAAYENWKKSVQKERILQFSRLEYRKEAASEDNYVGSSFYTINKPAAQGFILNFNESMFTPFEFQYYFDYLKEKTLELDYKLYSSDVRIFNRPDYVETIERHYMKPKYRINENHLFVQQYGNVMITQVKKDNKPVYLQLMCNRYQDRKYTPPEDFDHFIQHLFA